LRGCAQRELKRSAEELRAVMRRNAFLRDATAATTPHADDANTMAAEVSR
jgi:hypothetical protein